MHPPADHVKHPSIPNGCPSPPLRDGKDHCLPVVHMPLRVRDLIGILASCAAETWQIASMQPGFCACSGCCLLFKRTLSI